jgi:glycerol uptake facilitator protein
MTAFVGELLGTALLITMGNGVVANVALHKTYGNNSGLVVITFGWAMAVFVGVMFSANASGAHLNPAVTIALAVAGKFPWAEVPMYIFAQLAGACIGSLLMWLAYRKHFEVSPNRGAELDAFSTAPAIASPFQNVLTEAIATFVFMTAVFSILKPETSIGSLDALPVSLVVLGVGLCLGGPTGYAINPARDLGPRIMHALLPIPNKGGGNWGYAWVPVVGPVAGAVLAAVLQLSINQ